MANTIPQDHISRKRVVHAVPGMEEVTVRRDGAIDFYYPNGASKDARLPAVVFVTGFSDAGAERRLGCRFKDMGSFVSWAQLTATSGMVAVTYANSVPADIHDVLRHVRENAAELGIDGQRLGIWACSGHGPTALSLLTSDNDEPLQGAALVYPYTLDLDGASDVADAAKQFGFVTPLTGRSLDDLHSDVPMFVARAGKDAMPGLNRALDAFVGTALGRNLPISLVNHAGGIHGFDLFDDSAVSQQIIRDVLSFLRFRLTAFS